MNFFPFHIGDYLSHTAHLEPMEDLAYRRMIDLYFIRETCLPLDPVEVAKLIRLRGEVDVVVSILREFFKETPEGWENTRCAYEIGELQSKRMKAKESAAKRWESERNAGAMPSHTKGNATNTNTNTNTNTSKTKTAFSYPEAFDMAWDKYPSRPGASKKDAFKAWDARIKAGADPDEILDGVTRYAAYCKTTCAEPQYIKQATTFFGPGEHYQSDWTAPARASPIGYESEKDRSRRETLEGLTGMKRNDAANSTERDITAFAERVG